MSLQASNILDRITDAFFALDRDFRFTYANNEGERLLQMSRNEFIGHNIWEVFPLAVNSTFFNEYNKAFKEQTVVEFQEYYPPFEKWFDVRAYPSHDGLSVFFRDITEIKYAGELAAALNKIHTKISSTMDFNEIMKMVVVDARIAIKAESAVISLKEGDFWVPRYISEFPDMTIGMRFTDEDVPFAAIAAQSRDVIAIDNAFSDTRTSHEIQEQYNVHSVIVIPLFIKDRVTGAFFFNYHSGSVAFTDAQLDFARKLGLSISMALENARLFNETKQETRIMAALERISEAGISMLNLQETLSIIAERISAALSAEYAEIVMIDEMSDRLDKKAEYAASAESGICMMLSEELSETVFYHGKPIIINDEQSDKSLLGVPLLIRGTIAGAIFVCCNHANRFDEEDIRLFDMLVDRSALIIDNVNLFTELINNRAEIQSALEREKNISRLLERALMPDEPYINDRYRISAVYLPAYKEQGIGGDFYDVFTTEEGLTGIVIGDVSGKGVEAASMAVSTRSTVRAFAYEMRSPGESLAHANGVLYEQHSIDFGSFVTVFLMILDTKDGALAYSSAGHPPAVIIRKNGNIEFLSTSHPPLGIQKSLIFDESSTIMNDGDKLILYTDGILEARRGGQIFGLDGIRQVMENHGDEPPELLCANLLAEAQKWDGGRLRDDAALIVIERVDVNY